MPGGFDTPLALVFLIVPGFLLRAALIRARAHAAPTTDLYALAEAVVASLFVLAIGWWWRGQDLVTWADAHALKDHRAEEYRFLATILFVTYPAGLVLGWGLNGVALLWRKGRERFVSGNNRAYRLWRTIDKSGLTDGPSLWDDIWEERNASGHTDYYVRVTLKSGHEIVGAFDSNSWVALSPNPREVYLSKVYERDPDKGTWQEVPKTLGVLIDGADIESVEYVGQ
jgi:hypothetical protein